MAAAPVPATTAIRSRSVGNVETERLSERLAFLATILNGTVLDSRAEFGERVRECINVERELHRRGEPFTPVTDGRHLTVSVHAVPVMGPRPSKKEIAAAALDKAERVK